MFGVVWINEYAIKKNKPFPILLNKYLLFLFYGLLSFQALLFHLEDKFWLEGLTPRILFTSSYLCEYYKFFRFFEFYFPNIFWLSSKIITLFQTVFQFGMIPFIFFGSGKIFVIVWGSIFSLMSLFFLQISILPALEVALWCFLFLPNKIFEKYTK